MNNPALTAKLIDWSLETRSTQKINQAIPGWGGFTHHFDNEQIAAIQAAGLTGRPLLVRGDPGLGKSQLAPALASVLEYEFDSITIHADTEITDLLYRVDHIERLFQAQNTAANNQDDEKKSNAGHLAIEQFIRPGILWRAMAAESKANGETAKGRVVLIDEIDKAESSLPNALLEVLSNNTITIPLLDETIQGSEQKPLIVITSNDERELPAAFLRRCAVLDLTLKDADQLVNIYHCHKERLNAADLDDAEVQALAEELIEHRTTQKQAHHYAPGTAEFLDILSALAQFPKGQQRDSKLDGLKKVFMYKKEQREQENG